MLVYHGSSVIVERPEIRITRFNKDFYFGFYCTMMRTQAERWATRFGNGFVSIYEYRDSPDLNKLVFPDMSEQWLDFIAACRSGQGHSYDIVEGPMADDTIYNYVQGYLDGKYSREAFWALARFKHPTHQISFHTEKALRTLTFIEGVTVHEE